MTCTAPTSYKLDASEEMAIFDLAKQLQEEYGDLYSDTESDAESDTDSEPVCKHLHTIEKNGSYVCTECGNILSAVIYDHEAYAEGGGSARHHHRKFEERGILRELEKYDLPRQIKLAADDEYHKRVENAIKRGRNRESIIFACVLWAYKKTNPKNPHLIAEQLHMSKKTMSLGVKYYHNTMEPVKVTFRSIDPTRTRNLPVDLQHKLLDAIDSGVVQDPTNLGFLKNETRNINRDSAEAIDLIKNYIRIIKEAKNIEIPEEEPIQLYKYILNNFINDDYIGDRHNSKSLTAGIIYYILKKRHSITKKEFKSLVGISEITITKVVQEITELMSKPHNKTL